MTWNTDTAAWQLMARMRDQFYQPPEKIVAKEART